MGAPRGLSVPAPSGHPRKASTREPLGRHRRPAQRRQVHALQRALVEAGRGGELPVLHDRAERRRRAGARPAVRRAGEALRAGARSSRPRSTSSTSPGSCAARRKGEGKGNAFLAPHPRGATRSRTWCAASRTTTSSTSTAGSIPLRRHRDHRDRAGPARISRRSRSASTGRARRRKGGDTDREEGGRGLRDARSKSSTPGKPRAQLEREDEDEREDRRARCSCSPTSRCSTCANVSEDQLGGADDDPLVAAGPRDRAPRAKAPVVVICAAIEAEIMQLPDGRARRVPRVGRPRGARPQPGDPHRLRAARPDHLLHRGQAGGPRLDDQARRPGAAGGRRDPHRLRARLHQGRGDLVGGPRRARQRGGVSSAAGKMGIEGKEYVVRDGDVMHFRFNV